MVSAYTICCKCNYQVFFSKHYLSNTPVCQEAILIWRLPFSDPWRRVVCHFTVTFCSHLQGRRVSLKFRRWNLNRFQSNCSPVLGLPALCNSHKLRVEEMITRFENRVNEFPLHNQADNRKLLASIRAETWHMSSHYVSSERKYRELLQKRFYLHEVNPHTSLSVTIHLTRILNRVRT